MTDFGPVVSRDDFNRASGPLRNAPDFSWERQPGERLVWIVAPRDDEVVVLNGTQLVVRGYAVP